MAGDDGRPEPALLSDDEFERQRDRLRAALPEDRPDYDGDGTGACWLRNADGKRLYVREFLPEGVAPGEWRAAAILSHGLGAHCHRGGKAALARVFTAHGVAAFTFDHEAHGLSEGLHAVIRDHRNLLRDMEAVLAARLEAHGAPADLPFFSCGDSMGGALALLIGLRAHPTGRFLGAVAFAPAIHNTKVPSAPVLFIMRRVLLPLAPLRRPPGMPAVEAHECWRDPATRRAMQEDELSNMVPLRLATGSAMLDMTVELDSRLAEVAFPFFVAHGAKDAVCPLSGSEALAERSATAAADKLLVVVPDAPHDVVEDPDGPALLAQVSEWVASRLA